MWVCQSDQHLAPVIRKKVIPVMLRQLNIPLRKFQCPVPKQRSQGRGSVWEDWEGKGRRKHSLVAAEKQHADASPQHRTLAKEKQGSWTVSRGTLEMLSL